MIHLSPRWGFGYGGCRPFLYTCRPAGAFVKGTNDGDRHPKMQALIQYEIPKEVVREAIVNAVAHRDYTSNASVQVMLFSDWLEVLNPGRLPPSLTLEQLRETHRSVPSNPLLARSLYLNRYIEEMGTGTLDMIRRCSDAGLPEVDRQREN